ncbi:MAG: hypothetical protein KAG98_06760 [Lentisphaeria bacterium]|nr:hypothetical protein [Lentisphaeria bacterium]
MKKYLVAWLLVFSFIASAHEKLTFYLFSSSTCEKCEYLKSMVLPNLLESYPGVKYEHRPVDDVKGFELLMGYETLYKNDQDHSIKAFVGKRCLSGVKEIEESLESAI